jgi:hypothetical protein
LEQRFAIPERTEERFHRYHRYYNTEISSCRSLIEDLTKTAVLSGRMSSSKEILGSDRRKDICLWRQAIFYVAWNHGYSMTMVGAIMDRDWTTVKHGIARTRSRANEREVRQALESLEAVASSHQKVTSPRQRRRPCCT